MSADDDDFTAHKLAAEKQKRHEYYLRNMERIKATSRRNKLNKPDLYKRLNRESIRRLRREDPVRFKAMAAEQRRKARAKPEIRERERAKNKEWYVAHPGYHAQWARARRKIDPLRYLIAHAKNRAKELGLPFSMARTDLSRPEFCPVLGIKIEYGGSKGFNPLSPSIDRIIPALGYVSGNVAVISYRANELKKDASAEELMKVAVWLTTETERIRRELG